MDCGNWAVCWHSAVDGKGWCSCGTWGQGSLPEKWSQCFPSSRILCHKGIILLKKRNGCPHWLAVLGIKYPNMWLVPIQAQTWIVGSFIFCNSINSADANLCARVRIAASRSSFVSLPFSPMQTMNGTWRSLQTTVKVVWAVYAHLAGIRSSAQLQCNSWRFILASTPFLLLAMAPIEPSWGIVSQNVSD